MNGGQVLTHLGLGEERECRLLPQFRWRNIILSRSITNLSSQNPFSQNTSPFRGKSARISQTKWWVTSAGKVRLGWAIYTSQQPLLCTVNFWSKQVPLARSTRHYSGGGVENNVRSCISISEYIEACARYNYLHNNSSIHSKRQPRIPKATKN